nr:hypothetical protein BHI3_31110 [Bacteriovorax sp. HI3]
MKAFKKFTLFPVLLLSLSVSYSAEVKKQFYVLGGGGEPVGKSTIFDNDLKLISSFTGSKKNGWETTISFNGGHENTESIIAKKMSNVRNKGPFIESNYNELINEMIKKIESGELAAGDQLMVTIDSHGARKSYEKTHQIALAGSALSNLKTLEGAQTIKLDNLEKLASLAAEKGVKLALIDMSCFSGNLLNIKNDKVCFISATGPEQYGYAGSVDLGIFTMTSTFSGKFYDLLKKGRNLEEIFLNARMRGDSPEFPMISSVEGDMIHQALYQMLLPYMRYNRKTITDFHESYDSNYRDFENQVCTLNKQHNSLMSLLTQAEVMAKIGDESMNNEFRSLKWALEKYRDYQLVYEEALRAKLKVGDEIKAILEKDYAEDSALWKRYYPEAFINLDLDYTIKVMQELADKEQNERMKKIWLGSLKDSQRQKEIIEGVKSKLSDNSKAALQNAQKAFADSGKTYSLASQVTVEARKVYDTLYKSMQKESKKSNPCREFVL